MTGLTIKKKEKIQGNVQHVKIHFMLTIKVIEVTASSEKSFDDAVTHCVDKISKTVHTIDSIYISDFTIHVRNRKAISYGIICNVSFRVDEVNR